LLEYLGDLGGLADIIYIIGGLMTSFVVEKMLIASLIKSIYYIQRYAADTTELWFSKE